MKGVDSIRLLVQSGDSGRIGLLLHIVFESLSEAVELRPSDSVLEVAGGDRHVATSTTPCVAGSVEATGTERWPFTGGEFDVALSTFGLTFAPDPRRAVAELRRVVKPGGRIGLATWASDGFVGELYRVLDRFVPSASPATWGTESSLAVLLGPLAGEIQTVRKTYVFRYFSTGHWIEVFRRYYGPVQAAFAALEPAGQNALHLALVGLLKRFHRADRRALAVPAEYLQTVIRRA